MDKRIGKINKNLIRYSTGNFDTRLKMSGMFDETDALIAGINMLGEELKETTISRNYFNDIFHSITDMAIVINQKGVIQDTNKSTTEHLGISHNLLCNKHIDTLQCDGPYSFFDQIVASLKEGTTAAFFQTHLQSITGKRAPVSVIVTTLQSQNAKQKNILLMIKDISAQLKTENVVIRTIIATQEQERVRLAKDLHDSLGQQLSAMKFFIGTSVSMSVDTKQRHILQKSNELLATLLADMRNICFSLAPKTLEEFGLTKAVKELCNQIDTKGRIKFQLKQNAHFPTLPKSIEVDIFRIIQEFINNSIKHSHCSRITMIFKSDDTHVMIHLKDNGQGFEMINDLPLINTTGMGLQNVRSRARSHNIILKIESKVGKGTAYMLEKNITDDEPIQ